MAKNRINKINEEVRKELSIIIRELKDSRIPMMTSVVHVDVTNDLSYAKAYISVMGDKRAQDEAKEGLDKAAGFIRREIANRLKLRNTPKFIFVMDQTIEYGAHINKICLDLAKKEGDSNEPK